MTALKAELVHVDKGCCEVTLPYSDMVTQQQNSFHGGAIGAIADIAGGYSALTVVPDDMEVVTAEYKINFIGACSGYAYLTNTKKHRYEYAIFTILIYRWKTSSYRESNKAWSAPYNNECTSAA